MDKDLFFYELEGRGYTFQNKNWDEAKHGFEDDMLNMAWEMWSSAKCSAKAQVPEGFVLVPRECPDPIFADKLFDHLCKKAHGEFGDDQMIFFSDIDESAIWQLMIEAQEPANEN